MTRLALSASDTCDKTPVTVTFKVDAQTRWGENIYLVGNDALLSDWHPSSGIRLLPSPYPTWTATVSLPASKSFEYKFVKRDDQGGTIVESGANRTVMTPNDGAIVQEDGTFRP
jgi:hypothetical protein